MVVLRRHSGVGSEGMVLQSDRSWTPDGQCKMFTSFASAPRQSCASIPGALSEWWPVQSMLRAAWSRLHPNATWLTLLPVALVPSPTPGLPIQKRNSQGLALGNAAQAAPQSTCTTLFNAFQCFAKFGMAWLKNAKPC